MSSSSQLHRVSTIAYKPWLFIKPFLFPINRKTIFIHHGNISFTMEYDSQYPEYVKLPVDLGLDLVYPRKNYEYNMLYPEYHEFSLINSSSKGRPGLMWSSGGRAHGALGWPWTLNAVARHPIKITWWYIYIYICYTFIWDIGICHIYIWSRDL